MSIQAEITVIIPQIMNAVIFMDDSPAVAAFRSELTEIVNDIKSDKTFKAIANNIDTDELISHYRQFIINCQRLYLLWNSIDERESTKKGVQSYVDGENEYDMFLKVFYKTFGKMLEKLNDNNRIIDLGKTGELIQKLTAVINESPAIFESFSEFFRNYIYGYYFNYLEEQVNMKGYAEYLICVGVMGNTIKTTEAQKQSLFIRMGELLNQNRFRYISGSIPLEVAVDYISDRYITDTLEADEMAIFKTYVRSTITTNFEYNSDEGTIACETICYAFQYLNRSFISLRQMSRSIYVDLFDYNKFVLNASIKDSGELTSSKYYKLLCAKCALNYQQQNAADENATFKLDANAFCLPTLTVIDKEYYLNDAYKYILYNFCDKELYTKVDVNDLPIKLFPFIRDEMKLNYFYYRIRELQLMQEGKEIIKPSVTRYFSVRHDKVGLLADIKANDSLDKSYTEDDKKMMKLELTLQLVAGNLEGDKYDEFLENNVLKSRIYDTYVKFRVKRMTETSRTAKEQLYLLSEFNRIDNKLV